MKRTYFVTYSFVLLGIAIVAISIAALSVIQMSAELDGLKAEQESEKGAIAEVEMLQQQLDQALVQVNELGQQLEASQQQIDEANARAQASQQEVDNRVDQQKRRVDSIEAIKSARTLASQGEFTEAKKVIGKVERSLISTIERDEMVRVQGLIDNKKRR